MAEGQISRFFADAGRLWRYYQAGIVNTLFGYGLYASFVALGLNIYAAQALGHILGMTFNYFSYSRYAFRHEQGSKARFVASYAVNYVLGLGLLWLAVKIVPDPYVGGFLSVLLLSVINYFILSRYVFRTKEA